MALKSGQFRSVGTINSMTWKRKDICLIPMTDVLTKEQRSYCMSRIRSKDTKGEILLRSLLHKQGMRFRKNVKGLPGTPDLVFSKYRFVVFVDGDFWHGRYFNKQKRRLSLFWREKIQRNITRDKKQERLLKKLNWSYLRVWETDLKLSPKKVAKKIELEIKRKRPRSGRVR